MTPEQIEALQALKRQAEAQLELRAKLMQLTEALAARERAEAERTQLIEQLELQLSGVQRLTALVPYCSACQFNMVIPADPRSIGTVTDGVTELLRERQWSEAEIMGVELAVQEAVANAIRHGCGNDPSKQIQCILDVQRDRRRDGRRARSRARASTRSGVADPLHPDNMLKTGGRGIFLINQLMDEVGFSDGGRELQMRKRRGAAEGIG